MTGIDGHEYTNKGKLVHQLKIRTNSIPLERLYR